MTTTREILLALKDEVIVVGSTVRGAEHPNDLDLVYSTLRAGEVADAIAPFQSITVARGRRFAIRPHDGPVIDLFPRRHHVLMVADESTTIAGVTLRADSRLPHLAPGVTDVRWNRSDGRRLIQQFITYDDRAEPLGAPIAIDDGRGGKPASDECPGCKDARHKRTLVELARGALGLLKDALGTDAAPDEVVAARWRLCAGCRHNDRGICTQCNCHLSAKVRLAKEECPLPEPKWASITIKGEKPAATSS